MGSRAKETTVVPDGDLHKEAVQLEQSLRGHLEVAELALVAGPAHLVDGVGKVLVPPEVPVFLVSPFPVSLELPGPLFGLLVVALPLFPADLLALGFLSFLLVEVHP